MANKQTLEQMLEHLINDDQQKAEELFHEYVVAASREIYESLIDSEIAEETEEDEEEMEEAADAEAEGDDEEVEEGFDDLAIEADDEMDAGMGGDETDDLAGEMGPEEDGEEKSEEELFMDLDAIVDELQAKFDELKGGEGEEEMGGEEGGNPFAKEESFDDLATVREYVEKVPAGHGAEKKGAAESGAVTKSIVAGKNDMGGTTANILGGKEDNSSKGTAGGLANNKPKEDNAGNINVPGAKNGNAFSKKEPGHGAEKAGSKESADNKQSIFRGRR
jgi:hypothetical protein